MAKTCLWHKGLNFRFKVNIMIYSMEKPKNDVDTILGYALGTPERKTLLEEIEKMKREPEEIPLIINSEEVRTGNIFEVRCPHNHELVLARAHLAGAKELNQAIESAMEAHKTWSKMDWYHRASIFMRAADMLARPSRIQNIAAIMLNISKNPYEAEIDLAELVDFWRYNVHYMRMIYEQQPNDQMTELNRFDWRPLEGFVLAISPFNFYSIGGNLPTAPAILGNVALWKPARSVIFSNYQIMKLLLQAGLPTGVINFIPYGRDCGNLPFEHKDFAGLHFTGSYETLVSFWKTVSNNLESYKTFPRIVGETGGKDFIFAHKSAVPEEVAANIIQGAFGSQGQKCSAASRAYIPESLWEPVKTLLLKEVPNVKYGPTEELQNFMGAIITKSAYEKIVTYLDYAKEHADEYEFVFGGSYDASKGWFVEPTIIKTTNPTGKLISEEIFGPVITMYVYPDGKYEETLELCDTTSPYALTGAIFGRDREEVIRAEQMLRYSAGNFYINDKPTGAIVGRQPFGGARASGTNDKAGSILNLLRWLSPRTIKERTMPVTTWKLPYLS